MIQEQINNQAAAFAQMAYTQYMQQNTSNPYSQIVSNLSQTKDNVYPTLQTNTAETEQIGDITKAPIIYGQSESNTQAQIPPQNINVTLEAQPQSQTIVKPMEPQKDSPVLPLVHYGSDSDEDSTVESDTETTELNYKIPPDDIKLVIDKMASYVSKNGSDFESIVRSKGDQRFEFLNENHEYYGYYKSKIKEFSLGGASDVVNESNLQNGVSQEQSQQTQQVKSKDKKVISKLNRIIKI